jgi:hypothetical protein
MFVIPTVSTPEVVTRVFILAALVALLAPLIPHILLDGSRVSRGRHD